MFFISISKAATFSLNLQYGFSKKLLEDRNAWIGIRGSEETINHLFNIQSNPKLHGNDQ